ncbi:MAG: PAS domain S-box protein [Bacteroidales bacterium]
MTQESPKLIDITVLLAEDELHARNFTEALLKNMVKRVYSVASGVEGLELFNRIPIDVVITDIQMPKMNGLEMLRKMKERKPDLLTMITTAYGETLYFMEAIELGVDRFLLKPFTAEVLGENINYLANIVLNSVRLKKEEEARLAAEQQLRLSEEKFRLFFEMTPQGILIFDRYSHRIIAANQAAANILGYTDKELLNLEIWQVFEDEELLKFPTPSGLFPLETYLRNRNNRPVPVEINARNLALQGMEVTMTIFSDITSRKQAEQKLNDYQTRLEELVDQRTLELQDAIFKLIEERDQRTMLNEMLEHNFKMEKLISSITSRFINPTSKDLENEISNSLKDIVQFTGMDRGFFWAFEPGTTQLKIRILSHHPGQYVHHALADFNIRGMNVLYQTLTQGQAFIVDQEHQLDSNSLEIKYIRLNKIQRLIIYPIEYQSDLAGFIGLDSSREGLIPADLDFLLKITGKVFMDAWIHRMNAMEIRNSIDKITALLNAMPDWLIMVNREGKILEINESAARQLNVNLSVNQTLSFHKIFPIEHSASRWNFVRQVFESGSKRQHLDTQGARKYEHVFFPVISQGHTVESVGILSKDITQEYHYQQQLMDNYQLLETIINSIPSPVYYKNIEGRILGYNNEFLEFAGKESMEVVGKKLEDILPAHVFKLLTQKDEELHKTGKAQSFEIRLDSHTDKYRDIQITKTLFHDSEGNPAGIVGILIDITDLKRVNEELETLNKNLAIRVEEELRKVEMQRQALIQKSRIESLGQLAAGIAHEINQPLSSISLAMENATFKLGTGIPDMDYLKNKLETIKQNVGRIKAIIDHVKTFTRPGFNVVFNEIDLNEAVKGGLMLVFQLLKIQDIQLNLQLSKETLIVKSDQVKIEQVVINLVNNAKDALVEKELKSGPFQKTIEISTRKKEGKALLIVSDNGIGMDALTLEKIFEPFFTTKESKQGTGLGLSIVYSLVNEMMGEIKVKSQPGKGSTFIVIIPRVVLRQ